MIAAVRPGTVQLDAEDAEYLARALALLPNLMAESRRQPAPRLLAAIAEFSKTSAAAVEAARNASPNGREQPSCAAAQCDSAQAEPYATVSTGEAARILGITSSAVRQLAQRGAIRARRPAGRWLLDAAAVVARAERHAARRG